MSQGFEQQIFGVLIEPQPSRQVKKSTKGAQSQTTAQTISQQQSSKSSFKGEKYKKQQNVKFYPTSESSTCAQLTNQRYSESSYGDPYMKREGIEKCKIGLSSILNEVKLKEVGRDDIFYCNCNEQQQKNNNCIACGGKGGIDGNNNMIKFIEYVMEFKLGIKQSYNSYNNIKNNNKINKQIRLIEQTLQKSQRPSNQNTSILNTNLNKSINLTKSKQISLTKQNNRINQFCSDFIKQQQYNKSSSSTSTNLMMNSKTKIKQPSQYSQYGHKNQYNKQQQQYQTAGTIQSAQINNQSNINMSAIKLGLNSMTQSVIQVGNSQIYDKQSNKQESMGEHSSSNTLGDSSQCKDECYGYGQGYGYGYGYKYSSYIDSKGQDRQNKVAMSRKSINYSQKYKNQQEYETCLPINTQSMIVGLNSKKLIDPRKSMPCKSFMDFHQFKQRLSQQNTVHNGYSCDNCSVSPIQGTRYHCQSLMCNNDYDLCENCHNQIGHKHKMQPIKYTNLQQICEGLQQFSQKNIRKQKQASSISSVAGIRMSMGAVGGASCVRASVNHSGYNNKNEYGSIRNSATGVGISSMENSCRMDEQFEDYSKPVFKSSIR